MKIVNKLNRRLPINLEKTVGKLLNKIPQEHLRGIDRVIIIDFPVRNNIAASLRSGHKHAFYFSEIELNLSNIFWSNSFFVFFIPVVPSFIIANALYHEIGHNYHRLAPNTNKIPDEDFAEMYKNTFINKAFPVFSVIRKIIRIIGVSVRFVIGQNNGGTHFCSKKYQRP